MGRDGSITGLMQYKFEIMLISQIIKRYFAHLKPQNEIQIKGINTDDKIANLNMNNKPKKW